MTAGHVESAGGDAAQEAHVGGCEGDAGAVDVAAERRNDLLANGGRVGPVLVKPGGRGRGHHDGEHQTSDQPFAHESLSSRAEERTGWLAAGGIVRKAATAVNDTCEAATRQRSA